MEAQSLQMSSHLPAVWRVPTGPFRQKLAALHHQDNCLELWGDPSLPLGTMGCRAEGALLAKLSTSRPGPSISGVGAIWLSRRQEVGNREREQTATHTHSETNSIHC